MVVSHINLRTLRIQRLARGSSLLTWGRGERWRGRRSSQRVVAGVRPQQGELVQTGREEAQLVAMDDQLGEGAQGACGRTSEDDTILNPAHASTWNWF